MSEASARMVDVVVIGGGVAGLSAASSLAHRDVVLLERRGRLGGRLHSLDRGESWINLGAHLLTGGDSRIKALAERCDLPVRTVPGVKTALWYDGRLHVHRRVEAYPFALPLTIRQRFDLVRIGVRLRLLAARWARATRRSPGEDDRSYRRRMRSHRNESTLGQVLDRYDRAIADIFRTAARRSAGEADQITTGGAAALFGALWVDEGSSSVVNVDGGSGQIGTAMEKLLDGRTVLDAHVTEVVERDDGVEVTYRVAGVEHRLRARCAVVATPASETVRLVSTLPAEVRDELDTVEYGAFVCVGILTAPLAEVPWDDVYAIAGPGASFDMLFNHSNPFQRSGGPSPRSLMCYVGGRRAAELLDRTDIEIRDALLADVVQALPEIADAIEETVVHRWRVGNALPTRSTRLDQTEEWNERPGGRLFLAGDYFAPLGGTLEAATISGLRSAGMAEASAGWEPRAGPERIQHQNASEERTDRR